MSLVFEDRYDAGHRLAKRLTGFRGSSAIVIAIPRGGIPVAAAVAHRLQLDWNVLVSRKLPIPWNPEAGFGAVTADGSVVLNHRMVEELDLSPDQVGNIVREVRARALQRTDLYAYHKPPPEVSGRDVIILDDGVASGYTMLAAIKSLRAKSAAKVVAAAPVASRSSASLLEEAADECVFEIVSPSVPFTVEDYYHDWHVVTDDEIASLLQGNKPEPPPNRKTV